MPQQRIADYTGTGRFVRGASTRPGE